MIAKKAKGGRPRARPAIEARYYEELLFLWVLVKTRHHAAWEFIAGEIGVGSAKTLRVGLNRYRADLSGVERATLDSIKRRTVNVGSKSGGTLSKAQVERYLDAQISFQAKALKYRWRHLQRPESRVL